MKINIPENCIIINGTIYEAYRDEDPNCEGCEFDTNTVGRPCEYGFPCQIIFGEWQLKFKRVSPLIND